jgi:hypothetical protein
MLADASVDFIFSFDSLFMQRMWYSKFYVAEFAKKLRPDGAAFIHHSNLDNYICRIKVQSALSKIPQLPDLVRRLAILRRLRL